jgi:putative oxidoreductase
LQRLFSTFADGWPGGGLFIQRVLAGVTLLYLEIVCLTGTQLCPAVVPRTIGALAGILLLAGLWTPVAGILVVMVEGWIAYSSPGNHWAPLMLAAFGASLAMVGPGAWSVDARLFGRKRIDANHR